MAPARCTWRTLPAGSNVYTACGCGTHVGELAAGVEPYLLADIAAGLGALDLDEETTGPTGDPVRCTCCGWAGVEGELPDRRHPECPECRCPDIEYTAIGESE